MVYISLLCDPSFIRSEHYVIYIILHPSEASCVIAYKLINVFLYLYIQFHYPNLLLHIKIRRSNVFLYLAIQFHSFGV